MTLGVVDASRCEDDFLFTLNIFILSMQYADVGLSDFEEF